MMHLNPLGKNNLSSLLQALWTAAKAINIGSSIYEEPFDLTSFI